MVYKTEMSRCLCIQVLKSKNGRPLKWCEVEVSSARRGVGKWKDMNLLEKYSNH